MPPPIPVILAPYDPAWPTLAAGLAARLGVIGPTLVTTHHIGSTAVPGLAAKPIIDLLPVVADLGELDRQRPVVEALGFQWHGPYGMAGRRYCTLSDADGTRRVQLHCFVAGSPEITRHLAFRDYLRAHRAVMAAYEAEKQRARLLHPDNSHAYTDEKHGWIRRAEADALRWYRGA